MKKVFPFLMFVGALFLLTGHTGHTGRADWGVGSKLDGAWRMVEPTVPDGMEHIKVLSKGRFVWTTVGNGVIIRAAGGQYVTRGKHYVESIEHVQNQDDAWMVGMDFEFTREVDKKGKWRHEGVFERAGRQWKIVEVWERAKH